MQLANSAVLSPHQGSGTVSVDADVLRVDEQSFGTALHPQLEAADRRIGHLLEGGTDAAIVRVNTPHKVYVNLAVQSDDQVR